MKKQLRYYFNFIENCNMCGSNTSNHSILGKRMNCSQGKNPKNKIGLSTTIVRCTNCGLIYSNPQPVPISIQDHYGIPPEEYWKGDYFTIQDNYFQGEIDRFNSLVDFQKGMKSLDIGAGLGKQMIALSKAGFDTYGFEPSEQFYERAISKMGISPDKLKLGMIEEVEYPENYFDFISFGAVLEHLYDPSESIKKALYWLKPTGLIHIEVPSSNWLIAKILNLYYKFTCTDYVTNLSPMHEPFHLHEFSLKAFQKHAEKNDYTVVHHEYYVCDTFMPKGIDKLLELYMKKSNTGMQLCIWLGKK